MAIEFLALPQNEERRPHPIKVLDFSSCLSLSIAMSSKERNYGCAGGCAWTRSSGFKCRVLPAATYTFLSNCERPGARTSTS